MPCYRGTSKYPDGTWRTITDHVEALADVFADLHPRAGDAGARLIVRLYDIIGNPTLADAVLDRLVHNAYPVESHRAPAAVVTEPLVPVWLGVAVMADK